MGGPDETRSVALDEVERMLGFLFRMWLLRRIVSFLTGNRSRRTR